MKKAKTTKITRMEKKDSYGNTSFIIELENGDKGFYTSKNEEQKKFVVGQETEYLIEQKQGSKGTYYKITLPQSEGGKSFGGGNKAPVDPRSQMIGFSCAYAKDLVVAGKSDIKEIHNLSEAIFRNMLKLYDLIK